jgi:hypothetical protein
MKTLLDIVNSLPNFLEVVPYSDIETLLEDHFGYYSFNKDVSNLSITHENMRKEGFNGELIFDDYTDFVGILFESEKIKLAFILKYGNGQ